MRIRRILVPTDLSPEGERSLPAVVDLARRLGAELLLLHVVEDVAFVPAGEATLPPMALPGSAEELERTRAQLEARRAGLPAELVSQGEVIRAPSVPQAIADHAVERDCQLIALSTHGRSGFRRLIMGSVAEAVLRRSSVPVLVFPRQS